MRRAQKKKRNKYHEIKLSEHVPFNKHSINIMANAFFKKNFTDYEKYNCEIISLRYHRFTKEFKRRPV